MWEYNYTDELYHHGVKGMKWGVRRTKAQLGHKVSRGLKRTKKRFVDAVQARRAQSAAKSAAKKEAARSPKDMSDNELREKRNRLQLERDVLDLQRQISSLTPRHISTGEKVAKSIMQTIGPTVINVGKDYLEKELRKSLGVEKGKPKVKKSS